MTETPSGQNDQGSGHLGGIRQSITRRRALRKADTIAIAEEASDNEDSAPVRQVAPDIVEGPDELFLDDQEDKENDEPNMGFAQGKRKKRKSMARRFSKPKKRSSTGSLQQEQIEESREFVREPSTRDEYAAGPSARPTLVAKDTNFPLTVRHQNGVAIPTKAPRSKGASTAIDNTEPLTKARTVRTREPHAPTEDGDPDAEDSILSLQNEGPSKKRRKRKSITVQKKSKRRLSAQSTASASPVQRPRRPQARTVSPTATPYQEPIENEDETYIPEEVSPEPPAPAIRKKPRRNAKTIPSIESDNLVPHRYGSTSFEPRSGFPITTHRLVNTSALPTITEENEQSNSDHDLDPFSTLTARAAPNAVDVLAQICRESVASALITTHSSASGSGLKRKTDALESFGRELESRLFDMSAAVENRLTLEGRVRASKREKSAMQSRWVEVRRQREEVALKMDAVRREHWEGEGRGGQSWRVSEACFGIGVVIEREKGTELEGLEGLLGSVGRDVSGFEGGGTLQRVREFNARMERMIHVLEGAAQ
jgi:hypothetical protein